MENTDRCFCELAPFYALRLLDESEQLWVEAQVKAEPELAIEIADFESALTAFPYSVPPVPMTADLKGRLFDRIGQPLDAAPVRESRPEVSVGTFVGNLVNHLSVSRSQDLEWSAYRVPGVSIAFFHKNPETRQAVGLLKATAGVQYPLHRHADVEELYMLEGELIVDGIPYAKGDYIRSVPGSSHRAETISGCLLLFRSSLDNEYFG
jgi:anti-sigma factor ChrR (cupin superfamily)